MNSDDHGGGVLSALREFLSVPGRVAGALSGVAMVALVVLIAANVLLRNFAGTSYVWIPDIARWLLIWMVFLSGAALSLRNEHISMDAFAVRLSARVQAILARLVGLISLVLCLLMANLALTNVMRVVRLGQRSSSGVFPAWLGEIAVPVGFVIMAVSSLYYLLSTDPGKARDSGSEDVV